MQTPERDFQLLIYTLYASRKMTGPGRRNLPLLGASYLVAQVIGSLGYTYKKCHMLIHAHSV